MKKTILLIMVLSAITLNAVAQHKTAVTTFRQAGPYAVTTPFATDTVDVQGKKFDEKSVLTALPLQAEPTTVFKGSVLPSLPDSKSVGVLSFYLNNADYLKGKIEVKGPKNYKLYIDGTEAGSELKLAPEHHTIAIRYLAEPSDTDSIRVTLDTPLSTLSSQLSTPTPTWFMT